MTPFRKYAKILGEIKARLVPCPYLIIDCLNYRSFATVHSAQMKRELKKEG
jgi:hypothetical protein